MTRPHRSRRLALQGLCCLDVQGDKSMPLVMRFISDADEPPAVIVEAQTLLRASYEERTDADRMLTRHAKHWELTRLAMVDRNILRLAVCEMRAGQTPFKVVISEALRLAQEFCTAESPRFVNGVLDAIWKEMERDTAAGPQNDAKPE